MHSRNGMVELLSRKLAHFRCFTFTKISSSPNRSTSFWILAPVLSLLTLETGGIQPVKNGGFESANPAEYWLIDPSEAEQAFSMSADKTDVKEGTQSLIISADRPVHLTLRQQVFLPVGTLWRLTGWVKSSASSVSADPKPSDDGPGAGPRIGIEAQVGNQGFSSPIQSSGQWQHKDFLFRAPPPGRMTISLRALNNQSGRIWLDDIRLERVPESLQEESATISEVQLSKRPIDLKQGGQFIEPLCDVIPSLLAQQVRSTSFEEETPWNQAYKKEVDKPYRPWYPDGSVHAATYSYDTNGPYNGKRSQRIELPLANTWAGISQDGIYLEAGHSYRLKLHMRGEGNVAVRAFLHGDGAMVAGPVSLGRAPDDWIGADVLLNTNRTVRNATLTIEFEGPGTFWLDRVYLIDKAAVLGLWRPDVVSALKAMNPGIVRFGGSAIEPYEWEDTVGNWDKRVPFPDDPWGGLQDNFVGLEEFIQLVKFIEAEPLVCVRWTGKTPQDAANEVEYINGAADTKWGQKRAQNGHAEPYHVKYWEVGNEVGGPEYDATLAGFAEAMRKVHPSIKVLTSYPSANTVRLAGNEIDYLTPHHYSIGDLNGTEEDFKQLQKEIEQDGKGKDIRVSVTEWNATGGEWGLTRGMLQTMGNALACSRYQNMLHRYADLVEIANLSNMSTSFGGGQFQTGPGWIYKIPSYYTQGLYQRAAGSFPLKIDRSSALSFYLREPDLDATLSPDRRTLRIYAVNSTSDMRKVKFHLPESFGPVKTGKASVVSDRSSAPDSEAMNSHDDPNRIGVRTQKVDVSGSEFGFGFVPFSVTLLELQLHGKP